MPVAPQPSHGYFYPRSPCGERLTILLITVTTLLFLSTLSLRRATTSGATYLIFLAFLSTLSLRRATLPKYFTESVSQYFYPRSPCGERLLAGAMQLPIVQFLSTLSLRRATNPIPRQDCLQNQFLSTLSLRRATVGNINGGVKLAGISIHALLAESDQMQYTVAGQAVQFLSTLSLRRATAYVVAE